MYIATDLINDLMVNFLKVIYCCDCDACILFIAHYFNICYQNASFTELQIKKLASVTVHTDIIKLLPLIDTSYN